MKNLLVLIVTCSLFSAQAQQFTSEQSEVKFFSSAPVEDIDAVNTASKSVIDLSTGKFAFVVPSNKFEFKKKLMQEHFNENYMESEKYPKSTFTGSISNWAMFENEKEILASGELTIHGVTTKVEIPAKLNIQKDKLVVDSTFPVALAEYKIKIPKALFYNIADTVDVTVHFEYIPLTK